MTLTHQTTYTCRCGKRHALPNALSTPRKCGCGRTALLVNGKVIIQDKPKGKKS